MTALAKYDAARRAINEACKTDEVAKIRDVHEALRLAAHIAGNFDMEAQCAEIRLRAERRIGQLQIERKKAGDLHKGGRPSKKTGSNEEPVSPTLEELGIDKKLSMRAQGLAGIGERAFEGMLERKLAEIRSRSGRVSLDLLKETRMQRARAAHEAKTYEGGTVEDLRELADSGARFGVIYADPAWKFETWSPQGQDRAAANHYTLTTLDGMKAMPVEALASDDCVLFMWVSDPMLPHALELIAAWGFTFKTVAFTWVKASKTGEAEHLGNGYWTRANPEMCLLASRGKPERLHADVRQLLVHPVMEHSRKPEEAANRIMRMVAGPYLELFARRPRDGWVSWGNELEFRLPPIEAARSAGPEAVAQEGALEPGVDFDKDTGEILERDDAAEDEEEAAASPAPIDDQPAPLRAASEDLDIPPFLRRVS